MLRPMHIPSLSVAATTVVWVGLGIAALLSPAAAQGTGAGASATQDAPKAVLELFTSQGCSSCPPADALLKTYAERNDIVALTMPVDYWDYLGWKDTLASPKFTMRQKAYSKKRGDGRIYTPQMVINGLSHANGSSAADIDRAIKSDATPFAKVRVTTKLKADNGQLLIDLGAAPDGSAVKEASVWLATVQRRAEIPIKSGENRGKTLTYYNVVREMTPVGMWSGSAMTVRIERDTVAQPDSDAFAVLLQNGKGGQIIGASLLQR